MIYVDYWHESRLRSASKFGGGVDESPDLAIDVPDG
jgi:hypothetical protein